MAPRFSWKKIKHMDGVEHVQPNFPADAFAGTAAYYVRFRIPYPERLLLDLVRRSAASREGRLLDLACGPGRVALDLAPSFQEIWAVDLEPEMIEAGRREAARKGVRNIKWILARAEDVEAAPASTALITVGEAFHRLDQGRVAAQSFQWLRPGCCVAILGCYTILSGREPWQQVVADIVRRWAKRLAKLGGGSEPRQPGSGPDHDERVLRAAGFVEVASHPFLEPREWTIDTILGYLYSTSVCSKAVLGGNTEAFEADLKAALFAHDPSGAYRENTQWGYTLGRKPK
jgi:SAM-dependent methyltransferase